MMLNKDVFEEIFKEELVPTLLNLGFSRFFLTEGWIQPIFLFKHNTKNIWFGSSWDWRDSYFEAELGSLYIFKDVLPRVIVCGFGFEKKCKTKNNAEYITEQLINVRDTRQLIWIQLLTLKSRKILRDRKYFSKEKEEAIQFIRCF